MNNKTWIDHVHMGHGYIREGTNLVEDVEYRLRAVGMEMVADLLLSAIVDIRTGNEKIKNAITGNLNDQFQQSQNAVGEVFRALLRPNEE